MWWKGLLNIFAISSHFCIESWNCNKYNNVVRITYNNCKNNIFLYFQDNNHSRQEPVSHSENVDEAEEASSSLVPTGTSQNTPLCRPDNKRNQLTVWSMVSVKEHLRKPLQQWRIHLTFWKNNHHERERLGKRRSLMETRIGDLLIETELGITPTDTKCYSRINRFVPFDSYQYQPSTSTNQIHSSRKHKKYALVHLFDLYENCNLEINSKFY